MNNPDAGPSIRGSISPYPVEDQRTLQTGLELARASHLTMLRLQLALHKSNRRTAMQALDDLLDIDAEMERLVAMQQAAPMEPSDGAALFGFIGSQKEAIAAEKHVLTGGDWRTGGEPMAVPPIDDDPTIEADFPAQPTGSDGEAEGIASPGTRRWVYAVAIAIVMIAAGYALIIYLLPNLSSAEFRFDPST